MFPTRFDTNRHVKSQKQARGLKLQILDEDRLYCPSSENKGADQLCIYCTADLRLCFRICRLFVFLCGGSYKGICKYSGFCIISYIRNAIHISLYASKIVLGQHASSSMHLPVPLLSAHIVLFCRVATLLGRLGLGNFGGFWKGVYDTFMHINASFASWILNASHESLSGIGTV